MRTTVFITHAAPEDNDFALWLSSKLATTGYRVWVDKQRLRGGDDFWDEIDRILRKDAIKQIVVFTKNSAKPGVKRELAIGSIVAQRLSDPKFMIPIRADDVRFTDAPPEFVRGNILDAYPHWFNCLDDLFTALSEAAVPRSPSPDASILNAIVEAREDGRRLVVHQGESCLTNWFPFSEPPKSVRYYRFDGSQAQLTAWLSNCRSPYASLGRLVGSFVDPIAFSEAGPFPLTWSTAYDVPFMDFISGDDTGPFAERSGATNHAVDLLRQHFSKLAQSKGLLSVEFANRDVGWFFPDGLVPGGKVLFEGADGRPHRRALSGKFKALRWHTCLVVKPRLWPELVYRVHANLVLTKDGLTPLPGDRTHRRRRRLTRSWWNDVWRDRLLAAISFLADGNQEVTLAAGNEAFQLARTPLLVNVPVSYEATDPPPPSEEDEEGNIIQSAAPDDYDDDLDENEEDE